MTLNYFSRFVAYPHSDIPTTPWLHVTHFLENDSAIIYLIQKEGIYSFYTKTEEGQFLHRYEIAK